MSGGAREQGHGERGSGQKLIYETLNEKSYLTIKIGEANGYKAKLVKQ